MYCERGRQFVSVFKESSVSWSRPGVGSTYPHLDKVVLQTATSAPIDRISEGRKEELTLMPTLRMFRSVRGIVDMAAVVAIGARRGFAGRESSEARRGVDDGGWERFRRRQNFGVGVERVC